MTMVQTPFFEKKYRSFFDGTAPEFKGQNFPYILFFQLNHVNSKEWISLKKRFHEISPSTIHHMIPKRFLVQILQPHVFPEKTHSLFSFSEQHGLNKSLQGQSGPLQGHSCFFFCQTFQEVQKLFQNSETYLSESGSFEEPLVLSKTLWTKSQQKRFIPLGLLERSQTPDFSFLFWNPYDVQKILYLTSQKVSPHQQLITQVLYPTMTQPFHMLQNFSSFQHPFLYHHYQLYTLFMMFKNSGFKEKTNSNEGEAIQELK